MHHLNNFNPYSLDLEAMPLRMGKLISLQLDVDEGIGSGLGEL